MAGKTITEALRRALKADRRPLYQIARAARVPHPNLYCFVSGKRKGIRLASAERLAAVLGLELRPKKRQVKRGEHCE